MGLYDAVNHKIPCPKCGHEVADFQTKDLGEGMNIYEINQLWDGCVIYSDCRNCKEEVTLKVKHVTPPVIKTELIIHEPPTQQEIDEHEEFIASLRLLWEK